LHGSPTAKEEGELETQQHSRLVGRGKYIVSIHSITVYRPNLKLFCSIRSKVRNTPCVPGLLNCISKGGFTVHSLIAAHRVKPDALDAYKKVAYVTLVRNCKVIV
jgi:hypothetical protein